MTVTAFFAGTAVSPVSEGCHRAGKGLVEEMTTKPTTHYIVKDIIQVDLYGEKHLFPDGKSFRGFESHPLRHAYFRRGEPIVFPTGKRG